MAGSNSGFDAAGFREGISFAMAMGAAISAEERLTFHFPQQVTNASAADGNKVPFDPSQSPTRTPARPPVQVDCAVDYYDLEGQPTAFGIVAPSRLTVTVLDEEYQQIEGCAYVVAHGDRYNYRRTEPPGGLFDVGLYVLHFTAENET